MNNNSPSVRSVVWWVDGGALMILNYGVMNGECHEMSCSCGYAYLTFCFLYVYEIPLYIHSPILNLNEAVYTVHHESGFQSSNKGVTVWIDLKICYIHSTTSVPQVHNILLSLILCIEMEPHVTYLYDVI